MTDQKSEIKKKKKKKPIFKWLLIAGLALVLLVGFKYLQAQKAMQERRAAMDEQRQVLMESWQAQGLSEEEIQEKLDSLRPSGASEGERPEGGSGMGIMRIMGGGRGPGNH